MLVPERLEPVTDPVALIAPEVVRVVRLPVVPKRLVEKRLVVVAAVPVPFMKVRFWRVEDPDTRRLESVVKPAVAESVPGKR